MTTPPPPKIKVWGSREESIEKDPVVRRAVSVMGSLLSQLPSTGDQDLQAAADLELAMLTEVVRVKCSDPSAVWDKADVIARKIVELVYTQVGNEEGVTEEESLTVVLATAQALLASVRAYRLAVQANLDREKWGAPRPPPPVG